MPTEPVGDLIFPYIVIHAAEQFDKLLDRIPLDSLDAKTLIEEGFSRNNAFAMISGLKRLGIHDAEGRVIDRDLAARFASPETRQSAYRQVVDATYPDLVRSSVLETATNQSLRVYFASHGVSDSMSGRAARFFIWIALKAGYQVGEGGNPFARLKRSFMVQKDKGDKSMTDLQIVDDEAEDEVESDLEGELAQAVIAYIKESKTLPGADALKEINEMMRLLRDRKSGT